MRRAVCCDLYTFANASIVEISVVAYRTYK